MFSSLPLTLPPLENGDHLTPTEFERRYWAMPQIKKAELIEGIVYMASPLRAKAHGKPHAHIMGWLVAYEAATPGVEALDNTTIRLDPENELQPDGLLRIQVNGQSTLSDDDYIEGAPELIVEIAASSASIDCNLKLDVYRRNQVQEYLIWRVYDGEFDWFSLREGEYVRRLPNDSGILCSETFAGLWLDPNALLSGDIATVLATLQQGLAAQPRS